MMMTHNHTLIRNDPIKKNYHILSRDMAGLEIP